MHFTKSINEKGMVIIPKKMREKMELEKEDQILFIETSPGQFLMQKLNEDKLKEFLLTDSKSD